MASNEPFKVSLSTIAGARFTNAVKLFATYRPDLRYAPRMLMSLLVSGASMPFEFHERWIVEKQLKAVKPEKAPVFILGHWRSGTTLLHNMLSQDPQMAFVDTYQGVFPGMTFSGRKIFEWFMNSQMPETRPSDNVKLSSHFPQEEEFALGQRNPFGFYNFWFFPQRTREFYHQFVRFDNVPQTTRTRWKEDYLMLIKKALKHQDKPRFLSKNPPHTGRIPVLLEMFPDARFIYIYRNPITVFFSTLKLFTSTLPTLQFQKISKNEIEENIFYLYEKFFHAYQEDKLLIPPGQLVEIKYEDFRPQPIPHLKAIYQELKIEGFDMACQNFTDYADQQQTFVSNKYSVPGRRVEEIMERWRFAMKTWNYSIPEQMELKE